MKYFTKISFLIFCLLFCIGVFLAVPKRVEARAGGGHSFSSSSRSSSSWSSRGSSSRRRNMTPAERAAYEAQEKRENEHFLLLGMLIALGFGSLTFFYIRRVKIISDDDNNLQTGGFFFIAFIIAGLKYTIVTENHLVTLGMVFVVLDIITIAITIMLPEELVIRINNEKFTRVKNFSGFVKKDIKFNNFNFLNRVKKAFMQIQLSWSKNDLTKAEVFMADGTYEQFQIQINEMKAKNIIDKMEDLKIREAFVTKIETNSGYDSVYVVIKAIGTNYRINSLTNEFIEGNRSPEAFTEIWCFMRRTGSKSVNDKGLIEGFCPNCGAPIEGSRLSKCSSCGSQLRSGEHDWVLTGITQASEWRDTHNDSIPGIDCLLNSDPDFNIQNIEDKLSVMFWRMCEAKRIYSTDPIRKIATDKFIEKNKNDDVVFGRYEFTAVGSIEIVGIINGEFGFDYLLGQITWSGKDSYSYDNYKKSLFILKRSSECKTDIKKSFTSMHCPNCGAPMTISADNFCEYCNTIVNDLNKDWLLDDVVDYNSKKASVLISKAKANDKDKVANKCQSKQTVKNTQTVNELPKVQNNQIVQRNQSAQTKDNNIEQPKVLEQPQKLEQLQSLEQSQGLKQPQNLEQPKVNSISEKDFMRVAIAMMLADGVIDAREKKLILELSRRKTTLNEKEIECIIESMRRLPNPVDYTLDTIAIPNNATLLRILICIAAVDNNISETEFVMLKKLALRMQISPIKLKEMINAVYEANWKKN